MKKNFALSAVLVASALGMACGGGANSNVANTANSPNGNRMTNVASNANVAAQNANAMATNANAMASNANAMASNANTMAANKNATTVNTANTNMMNANKPANANK